MSAQPFDAVEERLLRRMRALAALYQTGRITTADLRRAAHEEISAALAAAVLIGTGGQRSAEVDAAIRAVVQRADAVLDALIALLETGSAQQVTRRLEAFVDMLDDARAEGERLTRRDDALPLVPVAVGAALAALLGLAARAAREPTRMMLPRVDASVARQLTAAVQGRVDDLARQLANGVLSLDDWHAAMRREVRALHAAYYQLGRGGPLNDADIARVNARVVDQWRYLDAWRAELDGQTAYSEAAIRARARLYVNAGSASLQEGRSAAIGLPPLPAYPGDGTTVCLTNCQCSWRVVRLPGAGNYDCYWRLSPAEHCDTCLARAELWNPISARGGAWLPFDTKTTFT